MPWRWWWLMSRFATIEKSSQFIYEFFKRWKLFFCTKGFQLYEMLKMYVLYFLLKSSNCIQLHLNFRLVLLG